MSHDEAFRIGRKAIQDARERVGGQKNELLKELEKQAEQDRKVAEAFKVAGILLLESHQETKH